MHCVSHTVIYYLVNISVQVFYGKVNFFILNKVFAQCFVMSASLSHKGLHCSVS